MPILKNIKKSKFIALNPIAIGSSVLVFGILFVATFFSPLLLSVLSWIKTVFVINISWFYVLVIFVLFCVCLYLVLSPYGNRRLGSIDQPKYSFFTWTAMLFSAGMGTGLLFSGVYEPLYHYIFPPQGTAISQQAIDISFRLTFLHWGFSGWVVYTCMGLVFSYFCFYKKLPFRVSSMLYPFLKEKIHGPIGWCVDIFAVNAILFGVATSLGRGALQINSGLKYLFNWPFSTTIQSLIIIGITFCATLSVISGLNKGIRRLSEITIVLCCLLLVFMFAVGPTTFLFNSFVEYSGAYFQNLIADMTRIHSLGSGEWRSQWTILYWAWWITWSPFVGLFIARISEGRTIREFILGALTIPTILSFLWFAAFGGTAIYYHIHDLMNLKPLLKTEYSMIVFKFLEHFPLSSVMSFVAFLAVVLFFVTSSDSASYVVHNLSTQNKSAQSIVDNNTHKRKIYWSCMEGLIALSLLVLGGIKSLELLVIVMSFPLTILICFIFCGFLINLIKLN